MGRGQRWTILGCCAAVLAAGSVLRGVPDTHAQTRIEHERETLRGVEEALERNEREQSEITDQIAFTEAEHEELNRRLIETAERIQEKEEAMTALEGQLAGLEAEDADLRIALKERETVLTALLGALQRMGRNPPPALLVRPDDALDAVRGAILMGAVMPEIRAEVDALLDDLEALKRVKDALLATRGELTEEAQDLEKERVALGGLVSERSALLRARRNDFEAARLQAERLGAEAQTLKDLIGSLETEIQTFSVIRAERARADVLLAERIEGGGAPDRLASYFDWLAERETEEERVRSTNPLISRADPSRFAPAVPFSETRGLLPKPVRGVEFTRYGADDGFGGISRGSSISTREGAQVVAPADGWISYAGPFRSYGQLLILDLGGGYHMVLAGMEEIWVEPQQFVLAGEPIGVMGGKRVLVAAAAGAPRGSQPVLYLELRRDGSAIDPAPWWLKKGEKAGG